MNVNNIGLWGFLVLIADIWAIISVASSNATVGKKVLWIVLILILPVVGFILWLLLGPRAKK